MPVVGYEQPTPWDGANKLEPQEIAAHVGAEAERMSNEAHALAVRAASLGGNGPWHPGVGQENIPIWGAVTAISLTSGRLYFSYFTAVEALTVVRFMYALRVAAVGQTEARLGLYSVDGSGDLALLARTTMDTTLFTGSTFSSALRSFSTAGGYPASVTLAANSRYAIGTLSRGASTAPQICGASVPVTGAIGPSSAVGSLTRRLVASLDSQTDLPTSVTSASLGTGGGLTPWGAVTV